MMNDISSPPNVLPVSTGALQSRNIRIHSRRTSVRLEPEMWSALNEIAEREGCSIHDLCGAVHDQMKAGAASFTAALRVFMMEYYRFATQGNSRVSEIQKQISEARNRKPERIPDFRFQASGP